MKWNIVADSSCDMAGGTLIGNINLDVVPLTIVVGDKYFRDDGTTDTTDLLKAMEQEKRASSTACPSPRDFYTCFVKADCTVCITITGSLSGTYNAARLGRDMAREDYPDKKIMVIDSQATSGKLILLIRKARELIEAGLSFEEVEKEMARYNARTGLIFALGGYDNLVKTGRMSRFAGMVATNLGIRAVGKAVNGEIVVVKKPRGERSAIEAMISIIKSEKAMKGLPVVVSHCNNPVGARLTAMLIKEQLDTDDITVVDCRGLTTFYTMQNGLIIAY